MALSFQQDQQFKTKEEERVDEFDFIGGLVTDRNETKLESNQSPNMQNVIFNDSGSIKTRNGYSRYNSDPIGAASDEANTGTSTGTITLDASSDYVAQTFEVGSAADFTQVDLYMEMNTSGEEQLMKVELWSGDTGPDAKLLDSQIKLVSGTSETAYSYRVKTPYALGASTEFAIVLKPYTQGSTSDVNTVLVHHTANDYASGAAYTSTDSGINWSAVASTDLKFEVYTGGSTGSTGLVRYYGSAGVQQTIAKFGDTLYRGSDATAITLGGDGLSTTGFLDWTIVNNTLLLVDGSSKIQKYNGSTNSNYSTGTISVTNGSATVTGSSTSWSTATNAEAGEYIQLPDDRWYKITSVGSDTSITVEVSYQGATASGESYVISPWGEVRGQLETDTTTSALVQPEPKYIENHIDRVWTLVGNSLRFSVLDTSVSEEHFNDFETSANSGQIIVPFTRGDEGTGLYSLGSYLYVFGKRSIWRVLGSTPATFELRNVRNDLGLIDRRTLAEWEDLLIFLSSDGLVMFDGSTTKNISEGVIDSELDNWANKTSPVATIWDNKYLISYTPSGEDDNAEAIFYDLVRGSFGKFTDVPIGAFSVWGGGTDDGRIYFASSNQGSIYRWDIGGNDDGYEITTIYDTPSIGFGSGTNDKSLKRFYLQQKALGDWTMSTTMYLDLSTSGTSKSISLSTGGTAVFDEAIWDTAVFPEEGTLVTSRIAEFQGFAKYFKFRFEQTGYDEGIDIIGMTSTARMRRLI